MAIDQHNPTFGPSVWPHSPLFEQESVAVAPASKYKGPGGCHAGCTYPMGLAFCQAQPSRHISSRLHLRVESSKIAAFGAAL